LKTMQEIWDTTLKSAERQRWVSKNEIFLKIASFLCRIEHLEFLDEPELRTQLLQHYCVVYATNSNNQLLCKIQIWRRRWFCVFNIISI
jgi:hypothetical protein